MPKFKLGDCVVVSYPSDTKYWDGKTGTVDRMSKLGNPRVYVVRRTLRSGRVIKWIGTERNLKKAESGT